MAGLLHCLLFIVGIENTEWKTIVQCIFDADEEYVLDECWKK